MKLNYIEISYQSGIQRKFNPMLDDGKIPGGLWTLKDAFWMLGGNACYEQFMLIYK